MPRTAKASAKVGKPARQMKQRAGTKATSSNKTQGQEPPNSQDNTSRTDAVPSASTVKTHRKSHNPIRTIHDAARLKEQLTTEQIDYEEPSRESHRMSLSFGHGHVLDPEQSEELRATRVGGKRKRSLSTSQSPSKKVKFDPNADEVRMIQEGKVKSRPVSPVRPSGIPWGLDGVPVPVDELDTVQPLPTDPNSMLLESLTEHPEVLGLRSVAKLFKVLQSEAESFGKEWFGFDKQQVMKMKGGFSRRRFPLYQLEHKYPALYWTTINVLDVPSDNAKQGWLKFFTHKTHRPALVYAILGEWISERVFKDSSFGLTQAYREKMKQTVDIPYLHYDSFVRSKHRAEIVKEAFGPHQRHLNIEALAKDSSHLAAELLEVLAPLMPTWSAGDPFSENLSGACADWKMHMTESLENLIRRAAGLSLSLTRTGENAIVFHIAHRLERGREFSPLAPMDCINYDEKMEVLRNYPGIDKAKRLMVRMTCWARVEAFVAHGMDQEEMEVEQQRLMAEEIEDIILDARRHATSPKVEQFEKSYKKFCWDCIAPEAFPDLPGELWRRHKEVQDKIEMKGRAARIEMMTKREGTQEADHDSDPEDDDPPFGADDSSSSSDDSGNLGDHDHLKDDQIRRAPYLTVFDKLVNHQVYCEWTKPISNENNDAVNTDGTKKDIRQLNSLQSVVRAARAQSELPSVKLANFRIQAWNWYASNNLWIEWASALAFIIYLSKGKFPDSTTVLNDKIKDLISVRSGDVHQAMRSLFPNLGQWENSGSGLFGKAFEHFNGMYNLPPRLFEKLRAMLPMPPLINYENGLLKTKHGNIGFGSAAAFKTAIVSTLQAILPWHAHAHSSTNSYTPDLGPRAVWTFDEDEPAEYIMNTGPAITLTLGVREPTPSHRGSWW